MKMDFPTNRILFVSLRLSQAQLQRHLTKNRLLSFLFYIDSLIIITFVLSKVECNESVYFFSLNSFEKFTIRKQCFDKSERLDN